MRRSIAEPIGDLAAGRERPRLEELQQLEQAGGLGATRRKSSTDRGRKPPYFDDTVRSSTPTEETRRAIATTRQTPVQRHRRTSTSGSAAGRSTTVACASGWPGSDEWDEFEATSVARPILGGSGNEDEFRTDHAGGFIGMSFRFFDPATRRWSIYWADSRRPGELDPPVFGTFSERHRRLRGRDVFEGRPILVRFMWSGMTTPTPRWEQAFSDDDGETWETNWIMDFSPAEDP